MMKENLWEIYMIGEVFVCWCSELLSKKNPGIISRIFWGLYS